MPESAFNKFATLKPEILLKKTVEQAFNKRFP